MDPKCYETEHDRAVMRESIRIAFRAVESSPGREIIKEEVIIDLHL